MHKIRVVLLLIAALLLCACDESEPLAPGESALSDVELDESEIIEGGWPADLLPEGFPEPEYTEIYSVERKDNEVIIIMFGEFNYMENPQNPPLPPAVKFSISLENYGYVYVNDSNGGIESLINKQGVKVKFSDTINNDLYLLSLNSPTGYAYEIRVSKVEVSDDMAYLFWEYPSLDTDLGLEETIFDKWPAEYLPDGFPNPEEEPNIELKIIKMEQKKTGVFITIEGTNNDLVRFDNDLYHKYEYNQNGYGLYINKNGDYCHVYGVYSNDKLVIQQWVIQINKCNDYVKKD